MKNKNLLITGLLIGGGLLALYLYNKREEEEEEEEFNPNEGTIFENLTDSEKDLYLYIYDEYKKESEANNIEDYMQGPTLTLAELAVSEDVFSYLSPYYYDQTNCLANGTCPEGGSDEVSLVPSADWTSEMCLNPDNCVLNDYSDWVAQYLEQ